MVDEETPLTGTSSSGRAKIVYEINIEKLRVFGLSAVIVLLLTGKFVTEKLNNWPYKEDHNSVWDKLFHGAPSDFEYDKTFIIQFFGFNHTCSLLDFNPSKTISALVIMIHEVPTLLFIMLQFWRIKSQTSAKYNVLKIFSYIASPLQFIFVMYFFMVFVNSPDGEYGTQEGVNKFILHYVPYMLWQTGMLLMAIQQSWFVGLSNSIPVSWVDGKWLWIYTQSMIVVLIVYTWFVWSFINGNPLWDTTTDVGRICAQTIMWIWNVYCLFIPIYFAHKASKDNGKCTRIVIEEMFDYDK